MLVGVADDVGSPVILHTLISVICVVEVRVPVIVAESQICRITWNGAYGGRRRMEGERVSASK